MTNSLTSLTALWDGFSYRDHQTDAIRWMIRQEQTSDKNEFSGGFLCDEMGLGKTMEILGLLKNTPKSATLLLLPLAVVQQWTDVALKCKFNVYRISKEGNKRWAPQGPLLVSRSSLYIVNYDACKNNELLLSGIKLDRVVMDEAHRLVNPSSKIHQAVRKLSMDVTSKWIVTATPIVNGLEDAKALFNILGAEPESKGDLLELIQKKVICRTVQELRKSLPELPKKEITSIQRLAFKSEEEGEFYRAMQGNVVKKWHALQEDGDLTKMEVLKLILRLRQISVHPQVYIEARRREFPNYSRQDWTEDSTKFMALKELLASQKEDHRWIIFCSFHDEMNLLKKTLTALPRVRRVQIYSGKQNQQEREEIIKNTKEPLNGSNEILLVQLHSGSVGLNLQHFDRIVFLSPWWTAALMDQAVGRAVRIGQENQVEVYHLRLLEEENATLMNIDKRMMRKVKEKRALCKWFLENALRGTEKEE